MDGPDWKRPKWGRMARLAFKASFPMAVRWADEIISDNVQVQDLFREQLGRETTLVGYGADLNKPDSCEVLKKYNLELKKEYKKSARLNRLLFYLSKNFFFTFCQS